MFIVKWWRDLEKDPLCYGLDEVNSYHEGKRLCDIYRNKGYKAVVLFATLAYGEWK